MKIAILIQGEPRFCKEFDVFLENLKDTKHEYDWYFWLWGPNPGPEVHGFNLIADCWRNYSAEWATEKLQSLLPPNHKVIRVEVHPQTDLTFPVITNKAGETNQTNVWKMFYSMRNAEKLRTDSGRVYDMVIKARPDIGTINLDVDRCFQRLISEPNQVLMCKEECHHFGYWGTKVNDWLAISLPHVMTTYCGVYEKILEYCSRGFIFHPESLLSRHLHENAIKITYEEFEVSLRQIGHVDENHKYWSDFGRWA